MENGNFVYKGWKCNGFLALVLILEIGRAHV